MCLCATYTLQWMYLGIKPTSHCLTTHGIPISVLEILGHIIHLCLARTVKLRCFFTEVSDCELMYIGGE